MRAEHRADRHRDDYGGRIVRTSSLSLATAVTGASGGKAGSDPITDQLLAQLIDLREQVRIIRLAE